MISQSVIVFEFHQWLVRNIIHIQSKLLIKMQTILKAMAFSVQFADIIAFEIIIRTVFFQNNHEECFRILSLSFCDVKYRDLPLQETKNSSDA